MSIRLTGHCVPPSSSLPPVRSLYTATEEQIATALRNLQALYCPLRIPTSLSKPSLRIRDLPPAATPAPLDSGYASGDDEADSEDEEEVTSALRADPFERNFTTRWLTSLIARADELPIEDEDSKAKIINEAAFVLASFSDSTEDPADAALVRDFNFSTHSGETIVVRLNDAPLSGTDHTDVGLQSWGASIVLSSLMCELPTRFELDRLPSCSHIIELGAGTGLVSLAMKKLLRQMGVQDALVTATDYHDAVLENLKANIKTSFPVRESITGENDVRAVLLDWAYPPSDLAGSADMLIATDVVYAPDHATWLRDCAAHLLKPDGIFWLMVTVRQNGKFEGIADTVESAFVEEQCPKNAAGQVFKIIEKEKHAKRRGIGRGDESGYALYRIAWS